MKLLKTKFDATIGETIITKKELEIGSSLYTDMDIRDEVLGDALPGIGRKIILTIKSV